MNKILMPCLVALFLAGCAPTASTKYQWVYTLGDGGGTQDNFYVSDTRCKGYAEQFRRPVVATPPQDNSDNVWSAIGSGLTAAGNDLSAQMAENNRINSIYEGCMAGLGWRLVPVSPQ